jgi:opacity protein-like surface antigen
MIARSMTRSLTVTVLVAMLAATATPAHAQQVFADAEQQKSEPKKPEQKPPPRATTTSRPPVKKGGVQIGGYGMFGNISFAARDSFEAITGGSSGPIYGGGARVGVPFGGLFFDVGAWQYKVDGERVFPFGDQIFKLGIPVQISVVPVELSAGWQFRFRKMPKFTPYVAGGLTSMSYKETSDFATDAENVDDRFAGYHLLGGAEFKLTKWLGVAGELAWTTVPDAIGEDGVSAAFDETDLGGTTFRFKITIGQ